MSLSWGYDLTGSNGLSASKVVETVKTNEKGEYLFAGWWAKERYHITVEGDGFDKVGGDFNATKRGEPGDTVTFEPFKVNRLSAVVRGTVRHLDGTPVVGAKVQTCGETAKTISATTDAEGRYELKALPEGQLFVTASKDGYRHTYLAMDTTKSESMALALALRRKTEAPAPPPEISAAFLAERKAAVREMLETAYSKSGDGGYQNSFFLDMLRLDPIAADRWIAEAKPEDAVILKKFKASETPIETLLKLAVDDSEEAIQQIRLYRGTAVRLLAVGELLLATDKPKALRFAEEAAIAARKEDKSRLHFQVGTLASAASLAHRAGNPMGGKTLFAETVELLTKLERGNKDYAGASIAERLAEVDLPAAVALLDTIDDKYYRNSAVGRILVRLAKTDPKAAVENLKLVKTEPEVTSPSVAVKVAVAIADRDRERAHAMIEAAPQVNDRIRGWMALAERAAPASKEQAWGYVDRAFTDLEKDAEQLRRYGNSGGLPATAFQLIYFARKLGHPDVHSLIARGLEYRGLTPTFGNDYRATVLIALAFSGSDPTSAKALLTQTLSREKLLTMSTSRNRDILFALAMCDPATVKEAVKRAFDQPKNASGTSGTGIVEMLGSMVQNGRELEALAQWATLPYRPISEDR